MPTRSMAALLPSVPSRKAKIGTSIAALTLQLILGSLAAPVALPGCPEACGNVTVPYPFGFRQGCFHEGFNLTCDGMSQSPKLFVGDRAEVVSISLTDGTMRVNTKVMYILVNGASLQLNSSWPAGLTAGGPLKVSSTHNRFVAVGCNILASLIPHLNHQVSICAAYCGDDLMTSDHLIVRDTDRSCFGLGCCQTPIARPDLPSYDVQLSNLTQRSCRSSPYGAVFIADQEWLNNGVNVTLIAHIPSLYSLDQMEVLTVLEWSLHMHRDKNMYLASNYPDSYQRNTCVSVNSMVVDDDNDENYGRCSCLRGYEGNPYMANGCQDIDECQQLDVYPCLHGTCINMPGKYRCSANKSIRSLPGVITIIAISAGFGLLFSLLGFAKITNKLKQRRAKKLRQEFFKKNHGLLLQQLISSNKDIAERTKIFSLEELEQSTNKFDHNRILGGGGHGTVYKGILSDQRVVAIKKAKIVIQREINQFINEVVILSQTNHRNVVKLFGCCLETEVPLLVYEFISNGTLSFHLHGQSESPLSWKDRLRIALETAKAIAYLHSAASISVYHRDIKCANILLTDTLTSKVSDFGASRSIAIDETGILTAVQGTYGYLDPEYYYTSRLTEKSDVYSFGVILAELLTRVTPVFSSHSSEVTGLASHFVSLIRDNRFFDIVDKQIFEEGGAEDVEVVARLAEACLSLKGEERPTMRQVETTLEDVQNSKVKLSSQTTRVDQNAIDDQPYKGSKGVEGTRLYSLEKEFIQSSDIPR